MDSKVQISNSNSDVARCTDALQAIKLDPAILKAQITMDKDIKKSNAVSGSSVPSEDEHVAVKTPGEECNVTPKCSKFEDMMKMQKAALLSMAPHQLELLLKYAEVLRLQRVHNQMPMECAFCKNNGAPSSWYSLHRLKDRRGRVRCPVLRGARCPACGATGDAAHTIKYCPLTVRDRWRC